MPKSIKVRFVDNKIHIGNITINKVLSIGSTSTHGFDYSQDDFVLTKTPNFETAGTSQNIDDSTATILSVINDDDKILLMNSIQFAFMNKWEDNSYMVKVTKSEMKLLFADGKEAEVEIAPQSAENAAKDVRVALYAQLMPIWHDIEKEQAAAVFSAKGAIAAGNLLTKLRNDMTTNTVLYVLNKKFAEGGYKSKFVIKKNFTTKKLELKADWKNTIPKINIFKEVDKKNNYFIDLDGDKGSVKKYENGKLTDIKLGDEKLQIMKGKKPNSYSEEALPPLLTDLLKELKTVLLSGGLETLQDINLDERVFIIQTGECRNNHFNGTDPQKWGKESQSKIKYHYFINHSGEAFLEGTDLKNKLLMVEDPGEIIINNEYLVSTYFDPKVAGSAAAAVAGSAAAVTDDAHVPAASGSEGTIRAVTVITTEDANPSNKKGGSRSRRRRKSRGGSRKKRSKRNRLSSKKKLQKNKLNNLF